MKIKMQAVPGPYHWGEDGATIYVEVDGVERIIATAPLPHWILASGPKSNREIALEVRRATARLLAAAPEMLEVLERLVDYSSDGGPYIPLWMDEVVDLARAAIAKARGSR
jgi:hypothetical protein